jgi:hypothetical protein
MPHRPRVRTDHTSHSFPATCRSVAGSRTPQPHHIDCSPRQSAFPGPAVRAATQAPPPGPGAGLQRRSPSPRWATWRSGSRFGRLPGRAYHAGTIRVSPHRYRAAGPRSDTGRVPMRGPRRKTGRDTPKRALPIRLNRDLPAPDGRHHRGMGVWACNPRDHLREDIVPDNAKVSFDDRTSSRHLRG